MGAKSFRQRENLAGLRVAFAGKIAGMSRRDAQQLVRAHGGVAVDDLQAGADLLVLADQSPALVLAEVLGHAGRQAYEAGTLVAMGETQFWQRLGLIEQDAHVSRMYTPAMLAELLGLPVATIRRWHKRGLLIAQRQVGHLPYFNFAQVATARQLASLVGEGASPRQIERQFAALARWLPDVDDPKALFVEGKQLLVRQGDDLLEAGGQQRFDFAENEDAPHGASVDAALQFVPLEHAAQVPLARPADLIEAAHVMEEGGQLALAAEMYRAALAAGGPHPETCFALAEVLYRAGELGGARERYYMAIELDENYLEARANLGCVLAESGQLDLAVAAFEGALKFHEDFPDAHYHLARALDELGRAEQAQVHWRRFLELAPDSPWADLAHERLDR